MIRGFHSNGVLYIALTSILGIMVLTWACPGPKPVQEPPAAEIRQKDGSLVVKRLLEVPAEFKVDPHLIPAGAKVARRTQVTVQPHSTPDCLKPQPVRVDLSLVTMPDRTTRVVASSPDGAIVGGFDVPSEHPPPPAKELNAVGLSVGLPGQYIGGFYDRDFWKLRVGVELGLRTRSAGGVPAGLETRVRVGVRF